MTFLSVIQALLAALLMLCVLLQHRAAGITAAFGGTNAGGYVQRRGAEKLLYQLTVLLGAVFVALTILQWYI